MERIPRDTEATIITNTHRHNSAGAAQGIHKGTAHQKIHLYSLKTYALTTQEVSLAETFCYTTTMKQVIVIHGGTTFSSYKKFIDGLRTKKVYLERLQPLRSWKEKLQDDLGPEYQVLLPTMPNASNARYSEWKLWFDRITEVITDDCILVGHSLGGIFLAKYLSESSFPKSITATILIAAPYNDETGEDLTDFKLKNMSDLFTRQAGTVVFYNGLDDPVIPIEERDNFMRELPKATFHTIPAPDHFVRTDFPELIQTIKSL